MEPLQFKFEHGALKVTGTLTEAVKQCREWVGEVDGFDQFCYATRPYFGDSVKACGHHTDRDVPALVGVNSAGDPVVVVVEPDDETLMERFR